MCFVKILEPPDALGECDTTDVTFVNTDCLLVPTNLETQIAKVSTMHHECLIEMLTGSMNFFSTL